MGSVEACGGLVVDQFLLMFCPFLTLREVSFQASTKTQNGPTLGPKWPQTGLYGPGTYYSGVWSNQRNNRQPNTKCFN